MSRGSLWSDSAQHPFGKQIVAPVHQTPQNLRKSRRGDRGEFRCGKGIGVNGGIADGYGRIGKGRGHGKNKRIGGEGMARATVEPFADGRPHALTTVSGGMAS